MIRLYYTDLIELTAALVFLVVFKIVLLIGMRKMSSVLSEESAPVKKRQTLSPPYQLLRYAVAIVLVMDGVWQIPPTMLSVSVKSLAASGSPLWAAKWWVHHALWLNIWSVVIALSLAALLVSFAHPIAVRVSAVLVALYGLLVWVTLQNFGYWNAATPSFLARSPGTGLFMAITCLPLIVRGIPWTKYFRRAMSVYWFAFSITLWLPWAHLWSGTGYQVFHKVHPVALPSALQSLVSATMAFFTTHAVLMTLLTGLIGLSLAVGWLTRTSWVVFGGTILVLAMLWVVPQGLGLGGAYAFALGSAPIIGLWALMSWSGKRAGLAQ